jgi:choline-sulfatase
LLRRRGRHREGVDYSSVVLHADAKPPQKYIVFTYDDYQSGQPQGAYPGPFNHIVSIREERYKLAQYYNPSRTDGSSEWEMYDLLTDPLETTNLAWPTYKRTPEEEKEFLRLRAQLAAVAKERLQPLTSRAAATS